MDTIAWFMVAVYMAAPVVLFIVLTVLFLKDCWCVYTERQWCKRVLRTVR